MIERERTTGIDNAATKTYKSARQSLRPLLQPPVNRLASDRVNEPSFGQPQNYEVWGEKKRQMDGFYNTTPSLQINPLQQDKNQSSTLNTDWEVSDTIKLPELDLSVHQNMLSAPNLAELKYSSTSQLRTLSKLSDTLPVNNFAIASSVPSVIGLHGRRQLKRDASARGPGKDTQRRDGVFEGRNWMDQQRQFLQAYEYLCHIGEAKEWIEDIIHKPLPPIVQLEEALRDGVTLAEIVQTLSPDKTIRIFRNAKLQFRHSDNIAVFFRFLAEVELPELFRFELIDLYEKKNIPKVIHCIHALSWLLYKKGWVDFRIGNLVGQLQFEHHELEQMQNGLDKSGVSMPSFSGMGAKFGAEPEQEPKESEEERIDRELARQERDVIELQAQVRGCLLRCRLGETMQQLWDAEDSLAELQSYIRGGWARQISNYRLSMKHFATNLQSAAKAFVARRRWITQQSQLRSRETDVIVIQSLVRARHSRKVLQDLKSAASIEENHSLPLLQAAIRGFRERSRVSNQRLEAATFANDYNRIQAAIRGTAQRKEYQAKVSQLRKSLSSIVLLQSKLRAVSQIRLQLHLQDTMRADLPSICAFQAYIRGALVREATQKLMAELRFSDGPCSHIQSHVRGLLLRGRYTQLYLSLTSAHESNVSFQAAARAYLLRSLMSSDRTFLKKRKDVITQVQSRSRGTMYRIRQNLLLEKLEAETAALVQFQSLSRALLLRSDIAYALSQIDEEEPTIELMQADIRGMLIRRKFKEKRRYFHENMQKVIKVQSFIRAKQQGQAYKSLTGGKNPPVGTVKNFVHLLNDSEFDFDEEVEFERLRKTVVQQVRQNEMADQYITQLDIKIALLVKNKITLDEVIKHQKHFGGSVGSLITNSELSSKDPFDLKALNKNSRRKLEQYQELFFILQTQPQYLARLFSKIREQSIPEKDSTRLRHLFMGLFGYAQKRREEYYLLKLLVRSIKEDISGSRSLDDYFRGNYFWLKMFLAYTKSPKDRKFLRDLIGPIITESIIENPECDLESDPMAIYLKAVENEQLRTGLRSQRRPDIPREAAIRDPETKSLFIAHLQDLREIVDQIFSALEEFVQRLPYGVRYISQQMFQHLALRFKEEDSDHILLLVGNWLWRSYLQPALINPDNFGVFDRGISGNQKRNLAEVAKVFGQIASAQPFGKENIFLNPLNNYISESLGRLKHIWQSITDVPEAEHHFEIDEFNDLYAKIKPTLYIKMVDIFAIHQVISTEVSYICPSRDDMLREVIRELGSAKSNESELMGVSSSPEICLTLNPKLHDTEDPDDQVKALFMETKRCVLYIIRVQSGANLMDIMIKPITREDETRWRSLVRDELSATSRKKGAYSDANTLVDIASLSYSDLKRTALENIVRLEQQGRLARHNYYQDILNAIAVDIRTKHRRRVQRARELEGVRLTLDRLNDQASYLDLQLKTYNDYIEQAMVTLQNKKGKKRFLMPFTKQWDHERELQRSGRVPRFGSYKYSVQELSNRGIVVSWQGYAERQWHQLDLTISSNEVGVFNIEGSSGSIAIPGATTQVSLDDLLQAQYNGTQFLELFGSEKVKVNVNLFVHLIMRKFYKDRDG